MGRLGEVALARVREVAWDCLSARHHGRNFDYYRAEQVAGPARFFALVLGLGMPLWFLADVWLLPSESLPAMAGLRVGVGGLLLLFAWLHPRHNLTLARVHLLAVIGLVLVFHLATQALLGPTFHTPALIGYTTLPLFLVIMLALFPLTIVEGALMVGILLGAVIGQHALQGVLAELGVLGLLWEMVLVAGVALLAQGIHLRLLMQMYRQATHDPLTGLLNRGGLFRRLEQGAGAGEWQTGASVLVVDLDRFKTINDRYGHPVGDDVLKHLSTLLNEHLDETEVAGRIGGEEFVIVSPNADADAIARKADKLRTLIAESPAETRIGPLTITASIGVADWQPGQHLEEVVSEADEALYAAKEGGRNLVVAAGGRGDSVGGSAAVGP